VSICLCGRRACIDFDQRNSYIENTLEHDPKFDVNKLLSENPSWEKRIRYWNKEMCTRAPQTFDIVICLGGDGTVLYASWLFQHIIPPVLAFGLGSLGFLTKFDFKDHQSSLQRVFYEGFNVSLRLRFEATVMRCNRREDKEDDGKERDVVEELVGEESADDHTHRPDQTSHVLNEVVIDRGPSGSKSICSGSSPHHLTSIQR
jgi:NAD+ kinase